MTARKYIDNAPQVTLITSIDTTATSITLSSLVGFPTQFPYYAVLDIGTSSGEVVKVTAATGPTVTVTRNANGLGAFAHTGTSGTFTHAAVALDYQEANDHVNATTGVHGLAAGVGVVGTTSTQTLTNKTLTSPTVNTPTVTSPTISNPTITGTATVATSHVTGNETVGGTLGVTGATTLAGVTAGATTVSTLAASGQITAPSILAPNEMIQLTFPGQNVSGATSLFQTSGMSADVNTLGCTPNGPLAGTNFASVVIPAGKGGKYRVSGQVSTDQNTGRLNAGITKNGGTGTYILSTTVGPAPSGSTSAQLVPKIVTLAANDTLSLYANPVGEAGGQCNTVTSPDTFILVERIA